MGDCPRCASDHFFNGECEHCKYPYGTPSHVEFLREIREAIERQDKSLAKIYESVERAEKIIEKIIKHTEQTNNKPPNVYYEVGGCPNCGCKELKPDDSSGGQYLRCDFCGYKFFGTNGVGVWAYLNRNV